MIRLSLYYRLLLGTFIVWGTIVVLNCVGLWRVRNRQEEGLTAFRERSAVAFRLAGFEQSLADVRYHLIGDPASLQRYGRQALQLATDSADRTFGDLVLCLRGEPLNRTNLAGPDELEEKWSELRSRLQTRWEKAESRGPRSDSDPWLTETVGMVRDLSKSLRDLNLHYLALLQSEQRVAADALAGSWAFLYGMAVAMLLPGLAIGILIARRFARPVTDLAKQANEAIEESRRPELDLLHPVDTLRSSVKALQDRISALKTELEQGRDRMAQSERLAVVGRVAASLTHEITRPLATVKFLLETGSQSQDVASADYQRALRDVERIETLLEEFLDFAGAHKPRFALVDVNAIVSDALQFIAGECEQRKMAVEREMGDCPHILGDETMLREAFVNIMLNALEAMSSGGTLSITTRLTLAGGPPPSDAEGVEVFFSDEGPGFSERDLERIFEPFYSTKPKGTGMGMTIVKRAVDLHGGSLRLLNREEGGAIVITFLPLPTPEQQQVLERLEAQLTPRRLPSIA